VGDDAAPGPRGRAPDRPAPSESLESLSEGLQNALWELGGVPQRHRTDRMTLAVNHEGSAEQYTAKYQALLRHYGLQAEATNPASGHENGDCEQSHRRFKEALEQELLLRGSRDFGSREAYGKFVRVLNLDKDERVLKSDIESRATSKVSVMPDGQEATLSRREESRSARS
jgi:hypothetical protein